MTSTITPGSMYPGAWTTIASGTGACSIASIPTGYKILRLVICCDADAGKKLSFRFNGDTANNYFWSLIGDATTHGENTDVITTAASGSSGRVFADINILNIATAMKQVTGTSSQYVGGLTHNNAYAFTGTWTNITDEINAIAAVSPGTIVYWVLFGAYL